jgi:hypothetical protein
MKMRPAVLQLFHTYKQTDEVTFNRRSADLRTRAEQITRLVTHLNFMFYVNNLINKPLYDPYRYLFIVYNTYTYGLFIQDEHKLSFTFRKRIVKRSGKIIHQSSQRLDYKCRSFESKRVDVGTTSCRQGHCSQENGDTSAKSEVCPE